MSKDLLGDLYETLSERKENPRPGSYTAQLLAAGENRILQKIGEEAVELILAAKGEGDQRLIEEAADLVYHLLVLLLARDLTWDELLAELESRRG